jgi:hypothetical protein
MAEKKSVNETVKPKEEKKKENQEETILSLSKTPDEELVKIIEDKNVMLTNALQSVRKQYRKLKKDYILKEIKEEEIVEGKEEKKTENKEEKTGEDTPKPKYKVTLTLLKKTVVISGKEFGDSKPNLEKQLKAFAKAKAEYVFDNKLISESDYKLDTEKYIDTHLGLDIEWEYKAVYKCSVKDVSKELGGILSDETIKQAAAAEKKSGDDFLAGKPSSPFGPVMNSQSLGEFQANIVGGLAQATVNGITQAAGSTLGVVGAAAGVVGTAAETALLCTSIVTEAFSYISQELIGYCTDVAIDLATLDVSPIATKIGELLTAGLQTPDEMVKELMSNAEKGLEDAQKAAEDNSKNKKIEEMKIKAEEFKTKMDNTLNMVKEKIDSVTAYIEAGPDWLEEKIDDLSYKCFEQIGIQAGKTTYNFNVQKKEFIDKLAENIAEPKAKAANEIAKNAQKKTMDKANAEIKKLTAMGKAMLAKLTMLAASLLGG